MCMSLRVYVASCACPLRDYIAPCACPLCVCVPPCVCPLRVYVPSVCMSPPCVLSIVCTLHCVYSPLPVLSTTCTFRQETWLLEWNIDCKNCMAHALNVVSGWALCQVRKAPVTTPGGWTTIVTVTLKRFLGWNLMTNGLGMRRYAMKSSSRRWERNLVAFSRFGPDGKRRRSASIYLIQTHSCF